MISIHSNKAKTDWQAAVGLIGAEKPYILLLQTRFGIHTFGVRFPIDVLILDRTHRVVRIKQALAPNRVFLWPPIWDTVLELPVGTISKKQITLGSHIALS